MSHISILVESPEGQVAQPVQVNSDVPLGLVIDTLVTELNLPKHGSNGAMAYLIEWQGRNLSEHDTLQGLGVKPNDRIRIHSQRIGALPSISMQLPRLKESFAYLPLPNTATNVTAQSLGAQLFILSAQPNARTTPIPISVAQPVKPPVTPPQQAPNVVQTRTAAQPMRTAAQPIIATNSPLNTGPITASPPTAPSPKRPNWMLWLLVLIPLLGVAYSMGQNNTGSGERNAPVTVVVVASAAAINPAPAVTVVTVIAAPPTARAQSGGSQVPTVVREAPTAAPAQANVTISAPSIVSRGGWGAAAATGFSGRQTPNRIVLSHDAQPSESDEDVGKKLRAIQGIHQRKGWPDISWHYIVDRNGTIYEGRTPDDRGDTTYDFDTNGMIVIGVLGDYDSQEPTQGQLEAITRLMAWLCQKYQLSPDDIYAHSYFANQSPRTDPKITSPGRNFSIPALQSDVRDRLAGRK